MHLDQAMSLLYSLENIATAMMPPIIQAIDVGRFLRDYVAHKMTSIPSNIILNPPRTKESHQIYTSPEFLGSILENLVKNSIEAMNSGGEIYLDWVFDASEGKLLLEVSDTGSGMDDEMLAKLISGESVLSDKKRGSGVGMLTVKAMLKRIGGNIDGKSDIGKGTTWSIVIPSIQERQLKLTELGERETITETMVDIMSE
jgi:signal transduction histidine kinase